MKKVLMLFFVLIVSMIANAGLQSMFEPVPPYFPGDVITVLVIQDNPNPAGSGGEISVKFCENVEVLSVANTIPGFANGGLCWCFFYSGTFDNDVIWAEYHACKQTQKKKIN